MTPRAEVIAVIGGGASGVLAAIHLLRDAPVPVRILIIEPRGELGRGIAYGTDDLGHAVTTNEDVVEGPVQGIGVETQ